MLERIISGGQTGADTAGLEAAVSCGIATGGWMPKGFKTENGPRPDIGQKYGLCETESDYYPARTRKNVLESQATIIIFVGKLDGGSALTEKLARLHWKP